MSSHIIHFIVWCLSKTKEKDRIWGSEKASSWSNYFSSEKHPLQHIYYTYVTDSLSAGPLSCGGNTVLLLKPPINFPRGSENVSRQWKYDQDVEIYTLSETHLETIPLWQPYMHLRAYALNVYWQMNESPLGNLRQLTKCWNVDYGVLQCILRHHVRVSAMEPLLYWKWTLHIFSCVSLIYSVFFVPKKYHKKH